MCPESFGGVRFDIILCMLRFNHVLSGDTLHRDAISSCLLGIVVDGNSFNLLSNSYIAKKHKYVYLLNRARYNDFVEIFDPQGI